MQQNVDLSMTEQRSDCLNLCCGETCQPVDHSCFHHVESSLRSVIEENSVGEVFVDDDQLWFVHVKRVCGPLLYLSYLGAEAEKQTYFWQNLLEKALYRFEHGHSQPNLVIKPPTGISPSFLQSTPAVDCYQAARSYAQQKGYHLLERSFPVGAGTTRAESIRPGWKFELREATQPACFWGVTVVEIVGSSSSGLLGLGYDSPELKPRRTADLRLFFTDPRLCPVGTVAASGGKYEFQVPVKLRALGYPDQVWKTVRQSFGDTNNPNRAPDWVFDERPVPVLHQFQERMLLPAIDPRNRAAFRVGIVEQVVDSQHFIVSLLEEPEVKLLCDAQSEDIVPMNWALQHGFLDKASLYNLSCSPLSKIAPRHLFLGMLQKPPDNIQPGESLEYAIDLERGIFVHAHVVKVTEHILTLQLEEEGEKQRILVGRRSLHLFPSGWCACNQIPLLGQPTLLEVTSDAAVEITSSTEEKTANSSCSVEERLSSRSSLEERPDSLRQDGLHLKVSLAGAWCPPIYFNHLCYSASFLRKPRLEALPRFIGPGPVRLVMREVLSRLIGSSFKSGAVLKRLEVGEVRRHGFWLETMKGKSRVRQLNADVEIPSKAEQVSAFCREVCQKLECCPYLFGPQLVGAECPSACMTRPKHEFLLEPEKVKMKGKRGRKRNRKPQEEAGQEGKEGGADESSEEGTSPSPSQPATREPSREPSPDTDGQPPKKKPLLPPLEMRTRGSKLAEQLQEEEQDEEEEEEEDETDEEPSRAPSPKFLRSRNSQTIAQVPEADNHISVKLKPAFDYGELKPSELLLDAPPVDRVMLLSNPIDWTPRDVASFIAKQKEPDVAEMAERFQEEQIDGVSLLLLNYPTLLDHWSLSVSAAVKLSRLVEGVKLAFYLYFARHSPPAASSHYHHQNGKATASS